MPIIAVVRELKKLYPGGDLKLHYIGPKDTFDLLSKEGLKMHKITSGKIRGYYTQAGFYENIIAFFENIKDISFKIPMGFLQSFFLLLFIRPKLVFSKGGTGSLPVTYCSKLLRTPVFLHESDAVPGKSNKITSRWAKKIFVSFEKTEYFDLNKATLVGNPIRKDLLEPATENFLNLSSKRQVVLFLGGSQGSESINEFILIILENLLKHYEIIHVAGKENYQNMESESKAIVDESLKDYYHLYGSLGQEELKQAYKSSDLVISRAGAGSIFEIAAFGKPSILVPLPWAASDHQSKNAHQYAKSGASLVVEQDNLTPNFFLGQIDYLLSNRDKMKKMGDLALEFSKPLAAENIAREIIQYLSGQIKSN